MNQEKLKQQAAIAAIDYIEDDMIIGVGTGTTANYFIEELAKIKQNIQGAVPSSKITEERLKAHNIPILDINAGQIDIYIDGADECNAYKQLIKGGGGALTREKILAACANQFICIIDESKFVKVLGNFPLPIEVIPMARSYVAREIVKLSADPVLRDNFTTDNGNQILDIYNLKILEATKLEETLNNITGIICNGIFAKKPADIVLMATQNGVEKL